MVQSLVKYLKGLNRSRPAVAGVLTDAQFKAVLARECSRCDRNQHGFSVVVFDLASTASSNGELRGMIQTLIQRKRATDVAGWMGANQIGVFLPETYTADAHVFADQVCQEIVRRHYPAPACTVRAYPMPRRASDDTPDDRPRGGGSSRDADVLDTYTQGATHDVSGPVRSHRVEMAAAPEERQALLRRIIQIGIERMAGGDESPSPFVKEAGMRQSDKGFSNATERDSIMEIRSLFTPGLPVWKRLLDIVGATVGLLLASPVLALAAVWIKLVSPGPVFFRQERVGYLGRRFTMLKLRTMHVNNDTARHREYLAQLIHGEAGDKPMVKQESNPFIIPLGRLLRSASIDELPQLINVLRGDMSLVGPRPPIPYEAEEYLVWHTNRFDTVPGMTGLWQVSGKNRLTFKEMVRLDIRYARNITFAQDMKILLKTVPVVFALATEKLWEKFSIRERRDARAEAA